VTGPTPSGGLAGDDGSSFSMMTLMVGWIVIAMVLYLMRPSTMRRVHSNDKKRPPSNGQGGEGEGGGDNDHAPVH